MKHRRLLIALLSAGLAGAPGCNTLTPGAPTGVKATPTPVRKGGTPAPTPTGVPTGLAQAPALLTPWGPPRTVDQTATVASLMGQVKLLSDHAGSLISDGGGGIISNNSGSLIGNNAGSLIGNNAGNYRLAQAQGPVVVQLAEAVVTVHDAAGKQLVDAAGKPIAAITDAQGRYTLTATLPADEGLVLRVKLWQGGTLSALLTRDAGDGRPASATGPIPLDLTTSSSLAAHYVLTNFVKGDPIILAKLPGVESQRLVRDLDAAAALITAAPSYSDPDLTGLAETIRTQNATVADTLEDIKVLLLGQVKLGEGEAATHVGLFDPRALVRDAQGRLIIAEGAAGRLRRLNADGTLTVLADKVAGEVKQNFFGISDLALDATGKLWVVAEAAGTIHTITGSTATRVAAPGDLMPRSLAFGPTGQVYIGEEARDRNKPVRVGELKNGVFTELAPSTDWGAGGVTGLEVATDGAVWALLRNQGSGSGSLYRLPPGAAAWTLVLASLALSNDGDLTVGLNGEVFMTEDQGGRVSRVSAAGVRTPVAGTNSSIANGLLRRPAGMWRDPDGTLFFTDTGTGRVHALSPAGVLRLVAGLSSEAQTGDATKLALNGPGGVAVDTQGALYFTEGAGHALKRFANGAITPVIDNGQGFGGDGGPASAAKINSPTALVADGDTLWFIDAGNRSIRRITPAGLIDSPVGSQAALGVDTFASGPLQRAAYTQVKSATGLTLGANKLPLWVTADAHQLVQLNSDATVTLLAGSQAGQPGDAGDGGPAASARFDSPLSVARGPDGAIYVADSANMRIRKIVGTTIEAFAGVSRTEAFARITDGRANAETGPMALKDITLVVPAGMCFDAAGNMYVSELGTQQLALLSAIVPGMLKLDFGDAPGVPGRVRKITPAGQVTVVAGPGGRHFADPTAADALVLPTSLLIDAEGRLVVVDTGANLIRFLPAGTY